MISKLSVFQEELKKHVKGQDKAVNELSTVFFKHLIKLYSRDFGIRFPTPTTVLIRGDTGVGKTYSVKIAAQLLKLPFVEIDTYDLSSGGSWQGTAITEAIQDGLLLEQERLNRTLNGGVIFLDEFDKITETSITSKGDDYNRRIQISLLKLIEGGSISFRGRRIPLSNFMFVLAGSFSALKYSKELEKPTIGFGSEATKQQSFVDAVVEFGLMKEIAGRIQEYIELESIEDSIYKRILLNTDGSLLFDWTTTLKKLGIDVDVNANTDTLVKQAIETKLGVRGLHQAVEALVTERLNAELHQVDLDKFLPTYTPEITEADVFKTTPRI